MFSSWIFARVAFYPSLLWGIVTESATKRWYDRVDTNVILGALPFKSQTKELVENENVRGVVTMNEDYETRYFANSKEEWAEWGVVQLQLATIDFNNAPSQEMLQRGVGFIEKMNRNENSVYVHCKAGRGRSTTLVACYLMKAKRLTPEGAYQYIKSKRPHILLAPRQWEAIKVFHKNLSQDEHDET
ncbi:phosphatidylglycerophosphatase and protein-tyrosine phosphatase 1-like isoform X1 [Orbicella faveolata]|uniref:phosphatidylglycerophosphatase and protein-tyrosine phosphatase 1-like isoform X1 n=1 Tax=Orbicella faveolata TaxID=48498 RepID=UPI0009E3559B|nr:phosphatidylglycerophosphatase and protein-tyrosine phosphatase 1-like isoform X1 [Orbicella faveolata]